MSDLLIRPIDAEPTAPGDDEAKATPEEYDAALAGSGPAAEADAGAPELAVSRQRSESGARAR